jgi:hypothetical protein
LEKVGTEEDPVKGRYGMTQETESTVHFSGYECQCLDYAIKYAKNHQYFSNAASDDAVKNLGLRKEVSLYAIRGGPLPTRRLGGGPLSISATW